MHQRQQSGFDEHSQFPNVSANSDIVERGSAGFDQNGVFLDSPWINDLHEYGHIDDDTDNVEDGVDTEWVNRVEKYSLEGQAASHDSTEREEVV